MIGTAPSPVATEEKQRIVRERRFPPSVPLMELLQYLRQTKGTGTLMIDLHDGGVGGIRYCEETKLTFPSKNT